MKKHIAILLTAALLLTGCATAKPAHSATAPTAPMAQTELTIPARPLAGEETATLPAETAPSVTVPIETAPVCTEPAETEPVPTEVPTQAPTEPKPQQGVTQTCSKTPPATEPPATEPPATEPPVTEPPATEPPATEPPQVSPPVGNNPPVSYPKPTENGVLFFMESTHNIGVGRSVKAEITYCGGGKLTWFVSHPLGITVDQNGVITPFLEGNYKVFVTDGSYTAVTEVYAPQIWYGSPHSFYFEEHHMEITEGTSRLIPVTDGTSYGATTYRSSDPSVVTILGNYMTAVAPGTAVITASRYGANAKMIVTVKEAVIPISLDIIQDSVALYDDETVQLTMSYNGGGALEWSSSNTCVARVDENGLVTAVSEGACFIYLSDGTYADQCEVTVSIDPNVKVTKLEIRSANAPLYEGVTKYKGDYMEFKVGVLPQNASDATRITVSDSSMIHISRSYFGNDVTFRLDFKKAGTCVVTVTSGDEAVVNTYTVHIQEDYSGNPGTQLLTPEEFVNCYNHVLEANGMSLDYMPTGYLVLFLEPDELTWDMARKEAQGLGHHWWLIGYRHMILTYEGMNEDGMYVFYERGC